MNDPVPSQPTVKMAIDSSVPLTLESAQGEDMEKEKRIQEEYVDYKFGFPVVLRNVEMRKVRDFWCPNINQNVLRDLILLALVMREGPLTGNHVHFIRRSLKDTMVGFAEKLGVRHSTVKKWEEKEDEPAGTNQSNDLSMRMIALEWIIEKGRLFESLPSGLIQASPSLDRISEIFVMEKGEILGLSTNLWSILGSRVSSKPEHPTTPTLVFPTLESPSREIFAP